MTDALMALIATIALSLFGSIIGLVIMWAIIRGAVLSALRKHADEQRELLRR